jgi:hypothetical protein
VLPAWTVYPSTYTSQVKAKMSDMTMRAGGVGRTYRLYKDDPTFPFFRGFSFIHHFQSKLVQDVRRISEISDGGSSDGARLQYLVTVPQHRQDGRI